MRNPIVKIASLEIENNNLKEIIERKSYELEKLKKQFNKLALIKNGSYDEILEIKYRIKPKLKQASESSVSSSSSGGKNYRPNEIRYYHEKKRELMRKHLSI